MIGTMAAPLVTGFLAPQLAGDSDAVNATHVAMAAGIVGTSVFVIGFVLSFFLPEPHDEPLAA